MDLSSQQTQAVMHGISPEDLTVTPYDLPPAGTLPPQATGFHLKWFPGSDNTPEFHVEVSSLINDSDVLWEERNGVYLGLHPSGFARMLIHRGKLMQIGDNEWETAPDYGFGGSRFTLQMIDGRKVTLIGPWHVGADAAASVGFPPLFEIKTRYKGNTHFGDYITLPAFSAIVAAFDPARRFAKVTTYGYTSIQPLTRAGKCKRELRTNNWPNRYQGLE